MKTISTLFATITLFSVFSFTATAADHMNSSTAKEAAKASSSAAVTLTPGEVKKIDKDAGKITIKHGPLTNLEMPAMTMVFRVKDAAMLDQTKVGDKINFTAERLNGAITVTRLETAK